jgi:hypothetical protein
VAKKADCVHIGGTTQHSPGNGVRERHVPGWIGLLQYVSCGQTPGPAHCSGVTCVAQSALAVLRRD